MKKMRRKNSGVIALYLALAFFSIPHLIDDFLFDIPADFGISVHLSQFLAGVFILIYLGILIPLARSRRGAVIGAISMGVFLALAGILKHSPYPLKTSSVFFPL
jgi:peptidoglycan/LPS O-acetylase OafA/YrhL